MRPAGILRVGVSMTPVTSHWFEVVLVWIAILSFQETAFNR
jgi:hypothetical protein